MTGGAAHDERDRPEATPAGLADAIEQAPPSLLGHPRTYVRRDVSDAVGVSLLSARRFWHALGFPRVGDDEMVFTEADVQALERVVALVRSGDLDEPSALALTRALARSADRLAAWQSQLVWEMLEARRAHGELGPDAPPSEVEAARLLVDLADDLEPLLIYAWRRHLAAAVTQLAAQAQEADQGTEHVRTVGFADMVGFTKLVRRLSERDLGRLVQRFEAIASDTVASYGGRLVKTIGDEVLFSAREPLAAAGIALALVETMDEAGDMPPLRVGLATGPVVSRLGDLYGTTVNLAARLTGLARPGTVLADGDLARHLYGVPAVRLVPLRPRELRGLGLTRAYAIRPGPDGLPAPSRPRGAGPYPHSQEGPTPAAPAEEEAP